jgi:AraC-like DNA-binding protein
MDTLRSEAIPVTAALEPSESQRTRLTHLALGHTAAEGLNPTAVHSLQLARSTRAGELAQVVYEPSLCMILQGRKQVQLGDELYEYDESRHLVASVDLPVTGRVVEAGVERPYLGVVLKLDPVEIAALVAQADGVAVMPPPSRGLSVSRSGPALLDAMLRLVSLLDQPADIPLLAPLIQREILYRLLCSEQGGMLRHIGVADSHGHRVSKAIAWLRQNFHRPLRIEHIAREVHLSPSALHHHFKAVTAMSPLQYQKQLRLQEARRLMLTDVIDAATAGHRVGYESPSQFSREYSRLFGAPPMRDVERVRLGA